MRTKNKKRLAPACGRSFIVRCGPLGSRPIAALDPQRAAVAAMKEVGADEMLMIVTDEDGNETRWMARRTTLHHARPA